MNTALLHGRKYRIHRSTTSDLPYYAGEPVRISGRGWLAIIGAVLAAFGLLVLPPLRTFPLNFIPALLFTSLPILTVMAVTGWRIPALFRPIGVKGVLAGLGFAILTIICSMAVGFLLASVMDTSPNPAVAGLADASQADLLLFLARTGIQLIGEELATILPLLAVLWLCVAKFGLAKRWGLVIAVIISTLWFAAMHLPTYNWNVLQCLLTIGSARLILTLAYVVTRNLWVSAIAHVANDWSLFLVSFAIGHLPVGVDDLT